MNFDRVSRVVILSFCRGQPLVGGCSFKHIIGQISE
nr:MAG TPA: DNA damage repair protein [Caudoviricetes sp.]